MTQHQLAHPGPRGRYSSIFWAELCGPSLQTPTLVETQKSYFIYRTDQKIDATYEARLGWLNFYVLNIGVNTE